MSVITYFKKNKINSILSVIFLILVISACTLWQIKINDSRIVSWEPDDHLHFLNKATSFSFCQINDECNYKNLITDENIYKKDLYNYERQIHRLLLFYHPLYTFLLKLISKFTNIFDAQKILHLSIGLIQALIIFYYVKYFSKKKIISYISILLLSTHYYFNSWGIYYPNPWTISVLIASLTLIIKRRFYVYALMIISGLFHKVGLIISILVLLTKIINSYIYSNDKTILKTLKNYKHELLITPILFILVYIFTYSPFDDLNISLISVYEFNFDKDYFINLFYENIKRLISGFKFLVILSPFLLVFFVYSFVEKVEDYKLQKLRIFTILLIISSIFYFLPSGGKSFALGTRSWHIISLNYIILSVSVLYLYKGIFNKFFKLVFILTLPIFIYWGFLLNYNYSFIKKNEQNYFLNNEVVIKTLDTFPNKKIYFDTNETNFYFFMANGLIKKKFYYKSNFPDKILDGILVKDNPIINTNRDSNIIIENNTNINITNNENDNNKVELTIFSLGFTNLSINNKDFIINKGINSIQISSGQNYLFKDVSKTIYLIGLKVNDDQNLQWPWGKNILMKIKLKEFYQINIKDVISYYLRFPPFESYEDELKFNFKSLPQLSGLCKNHQIISDIGSTIIFENNCTSLNN